MNRLINLSSDIYVDENFRTFAEIKSTVLENSSPVGSQMMVIRIGDEYEGTISHSNSIVELV